VVCHTCKGTGCERIVVDYEPFAGRLAPEGVFRVFEANPGIVIGRGPHGIYKLVDFGGQPVIDWLNGTPFPPKSENRAFTCPAWWYQSADYNKKPKWDECIGCGSFTNCAHFDSKEKCWERFDAEQLVQIAGVK